MEVNLEQEKETLDPELGHKISHSLANLIELTRRLTVDLSPPLLATDGFADGLRYLQDHSRQLFA